MQVCKTRGSQECAFKPSLEGNFHSQRPLNRRKWSSRVSPRLIHKAPPPATQYSAGRILRL